MSDNPVIHTPHTMVIECRTGGGGVLIGPAVLLAVIVGA